MKLTCVLLIVFSLLQFGRTSYARNGPEDYWRSVMKEQPIPEAIQKLVQDQPASSEEARRDPFVKDFKVKQTLIIYRSHGDPNRARSLDHRDSIHGQEEKAKLGKQASMKH